MTTTPENSKLFSDPRLLSLGVVNAMASRHFGNMREEENKNKLFESLGINPQNILRFKQTHSDTIIPILSKEEALNHQGKDIQEADAWILKGRGFGALILTADCVPLFVWDAKANFIGVAHSGWRGVVKQLPYKLVEEMKKLGAEGPFYAYAGPHIQKCCFEVQADVEKQFSPQSVICKNGKTFVDINWEVQRQLTQAGIKKEDIRFPYYCTCGDKANFFSYRRDRTKDSLMSFVYKP